MVLRLILVWGPSSVEGIVVLAMHVAFVHVLVVALLSEYRSAHLPYPAEVAVRPPSEVAGDPLLEVGGDTPYAVGI